MVSGDKIGKPSRIDPKIDPRIDPWDLASYGLLALLSIFAVATFRDYGISNDEDVQHRYGAMIIAYYISGLLDRSLFEFKNLYLYGGLFDVVAVLLEKALPFDRYFIRHFLSGLIGVAGMAATWATARLIGGPRTGFIAAAALAVCGPWIGAMFNHTKDIPFAAAMMGATYFLLRISRELPNARWRHVLGFGLLLGAALGLRVMGLLLVGYAGIAVLLAAANASRIYPTCGERHRRAVAILIRSSLCLIPAFALGYLIMIVFWPWAALSPLNPIRAIVSFADFHYQIRTIFADRIYDMAEVPWWYVPGYLAIKLPVVILGGAILALPFLVLEHFPEKWTPVFRRKCDQARNPGPAYFRRRKILLIAFIAAFPLACEMILEGPAFSGVRHYSFLIPPLAVLAAFGFDAALRSLPFALLRTAAIAAIACLFLWEGATLVRLHPYEVMHYNVLVGGLDGASRQYVMDYWLNMLPEAMRELGAYLDRIEAREGVRRTYSVGICGEKFAFEHYADPRMQYTNGWLEADFYISPTNMDCDRLVDGKTIVSIERFGAPIGIVKDRRGFVQAELNPLRWPKVLATPR
ncbi:MAG TPA: glycosyltransferase family 39 protein [Pseudorhodoplanes sp.]|nr:glycosyltransferase family 39 protein [Pseudorhodoplanes sp.]